jgi:RNA polymerase sigma-70 factor (ECF subfamily)
MCSDEISVEELIARARTDQDWLGRLLARYEGYLLLEGRQRIGPKLAVHCDPADAVQETFARAVRGFPQFNGTREAQFTSWLRKIFENYVTDVIRKGARRSETVDLAVPMAPSDGSASLIWTEPATDESTPSQHFIRGEKALRLGQLLEKLPADQRDAVRLRHLKGWSLKQTAEHMGVSEASVAGLLYRAIKKLRASMSESSWL